MVGRDGRRISLLSVAQLLHKHLTSALCESAWLRVRSTERARLWTLELLAKFWTPAIHNTAEELEDVRGVFARRGAR